MLSLVRSYTISTSLKSRTAIIHKFQPVPNGKTIPNSVLSLQNPCPSSDPSIKKRSSNKFHIPKFGQVRGTTGLLARTPVRYAHTGTPASTSLLQSEASSIPEPALEQSGINVQGVAALDEKVELLNIPEPPPIVEELVSKIVLNSAGEPTFESLGLGSWYPPGIVQQFLEYLHITGGFPWWAAILTGTIVVRLAVFPLVIKSQRNAAKMRNHLPEMQMLQLKMSEARQMGDAMMTAKYSNDLMMFMKEKDVNPLKSMIVPMAMAPVFVSFFFGLRKMANLPVESLRDGGLFWFTDLTVPDPYYVLPLITSLTLWITLEIGADGVQMNTGPHSNLMKYALRIIPVVIFPLTMSFPAALLCYWVSTNAISLIQVSFLKIPAVREKFGIAPLRAISVEALPIKKKGFVDSAKDSWSNIKITKEVEERERFDEMNFKRAGRGPLPKTYKYDPTKVQARSK